MIRKDLNRPVFQLDNEAFKTLFLQKANKRLHKKKKASKFIIDKYNRHLLNQLYYYLIGSDKFEKDLEKGIVLGGKFGCGKTLIFESFVDVWNHCVRANSGSVLKQIWYPDQFVSATSIDLFNMSLNSSTTSNHDDLERYLKSNLFIDDLGKEETAAKDFGTEKFPLKEILMHKYNDSKLTIATANYDWEDFKDIYGRMIADRMIEMFNFLELPGNSRRA